jgi:hypothetical protein
MRLRSAIVSTATSISIRLIRPSTGTRHKDSFNIIGKRHNCFIKLPPLRIERLAYKDVISKQ